MERANVYAVLAKELEQWRLRPAADLASLAGALPSVREAHIAGEVVTIEVSVAWTDASHESLRIEAVANGPSHWNTERLVERITVSVDSPTSE